MRDIDVIDAELRLVAALRRAAEERGGPLPSIDVADALLGRTRSADRRQSFVTAMHSTSTSKGPVHSGTQKKMRAGGVFGKKRL